MCQVLPGLASRGTFSPYLYDSGGVGEQEERRYLRAEKKRRDWMRPIHKGYVDIGRVDENDPKEDINGENSKGCGFCNGIALW